MYLYLWLKNWFESNEEGQGLVEYALIIFLVSIAVIATLGILGGQIDGVFGQIVTALGG
ncbi:MAG: Flp family type IVb pilin [Anaerolineae bacterium]|jgi:pilus assembly protein Flp/PilA|nr:Flp family type IVb pilin [Anaerolineae bacterium]